MKKIISLSLCLVSFVTIMTAQTPEATPTPTVPTTSIEFTDTEFNWGELIEGEKIQNVFTLTNTGNEPLVIKNAKGSCGCTVPRWPREPLMPGESAEILVQFDSKGKGKIGGSKQAKRVTITANTDPANTYLTIKGVVHKLEKEEKQTKPAAVRNNNFDLSSSVLSVYPNPAAEVLNLQINDIDAEKALIEIYDATGQKMLSQNITVSKGSTEFDISNYPSGIYAVTLKVEGKNRLAKQFIKS